MAKVRVRVRVWLRDAGKLGAAAGSGRGGRRRPGCRGGCISGCGREWQALDVEAKLLELVVHSGRRGHEHPRRDHHGGELLEQELGRVGHVHLGDAAVATGAAAEGVGLQVYVRHEPAALADVDAVGVAVEEHSLLQERRGAVRDDAVALHLAKAEAAVLSTPLHGLAREELHGAAAARVHLVVHHMLQALVVHGAEEDLGLHLPPGVAVVHDLVSGALVADLLQVARHRLHVEGLDEGRSVALGAVVRHDLAQEALDQVPHGHSRRHGVRVHDDVGDDALAGEGHVLHAERHADGPLLTVPGRELVADLRVADVAHAHLGEALSVAVRAEEHAVHHARLGDAGLDAGAALRVARRLAGDGRRVRHRHRLADDDVAAEHCRSGLHQAVLVELAKVRVAHASGDGRVGLLELVPLLLSGARHGKEGRPVRRGQRDVLLRRRVGAVEDGAEEAAVDGALVHDEGVLLVVAGKRGNGHDGVDAGRELAEVHVLHGVGRHEGLLGIVQHVGHGVHAGREVGGVDAHGLLAHGRLVRVSGGLVVVWEGDDGRADAKDHGGVDLAVRVGGADALLQVALCHCDHAALLFLRVDELQRALLHEQGVPALGLRDDLLPLQPLLLGLVLLGLVQAAEGRRGEQVEGVDGVRRELEALLVVLLHHDVEGPADAAGVGVDVDLLRGDLPHDGHL
mmetsp:Transcript_15972/g.60416  ORF Transcript_15972/g.60416 Transcript_15972/m.60416 type:complete len:683 (-) Transcript_15972:428-2476(-)